MIQRKGLCDNQYARGHRKEKYLQQLLRCIKNGRGAEAIRWRPWRVARSARQWTQPNKPLNFIQPRRFARTVAGRERLRFQQLWPDDSVELFQILASSNISVKCSLVRIIRLDVVRYRGFYGAGKAAGSIVRP